MNMIIFASCLLGHNKYLIEFPTRNKPLLASNFDAITLASLYFNQSLQPFQNSSQM